MFKDFVREGELRQLAIWAGAGILLIASIVLQIYFESVCWDTSTSKALKIDEAAGCFEFWFNRYQSIIATIVTVLVAVLALRPALGQLKEMQIQTDQKRADNIYRQIDQYNDLEDAVYALNLAVSSLEFDLISIISEQPITRRRYAIEQFVRNEKIFRTEMDRSISVIRKKSDITQSFKIKNAFVESVYDFSSDVGAFYVPITWASAKRPDENWDALFWRLSAAITDERDAIQIAIATANIVKINGERYHTDTIAQKIKLQLEFSDKVR